MTVIYVDQLFFLNFIANYLILLGTGRITGAVLHRLRVAAGAAVGGIYAVLVLLPAAAWTGGWICKLVVGALIVLIAYGGERRLLKNMISFFCASAGLAGLIIAIEWFGKTALSIQIGVLYSDFDLRLLILIFIICYFLMSLFFRRTGRHAARETVQLTVCLFNATIKMAALLDSGHTLTDPATNRPVIVANANLFHTCLPDGIDLSDPVESLKKCRDSGMKNVRLIPYRAIGIECGMLLALRAEKVLSSNRNLGNLLIALSPTPVDDGGGHDALIGGI